MNPKDLERKFIPFTAAAAGASSWSVKGDQFEGLLSTWSLDLGGDVIHQGAFKKTLAEWKRRGHPLPLIDNHNYRSVRDVIGKLIEAEERPEGLWTRWRLVDGPDGDQIRVRLEGGFIDGMSIGYAAVRSRAPSDDERRRGISRHLDEVSLREGSVVIWPMNQGARIDPPADDGKGGQDAEDRAREATLRAIIDRAVATEESQRKAQLDALLQRQAELERRELEEATRRSVAEAASRLELVMAKVARVQTAVLDPSRCISGWASTSELDSYDEFIDPDAHRGWLAAWKAGQLHVPILISHDRTRHVGDLAAAEIVPGDGLWITVQLHDTPEGRAALADVKAGRITGLSINSRRPEGHVVALPGGATIRGVTSVAVDEISLAVRPACPSARIQLDGKRRDPRDLGHGNFFDAAGRPTKLRPLYLSEPSRV